MKKEAPGTTKTSKEQRQRKFGKFKDKMHSMWGNPFSKGVGEGSTIVCPDCGICYEASYKDGKWYCKRCGKECTAHERSYKST